MSSADVLSAVERRAAATGFALDPAQRAVAPVLADLVAAAGSAAGRRWRIGARRRWGLGPGGRSRSGGYLWGGVGRGKTWLMDAVVAAVPPDQVLRVHFHEFFQQLHAALGRHRGRAGAMAAAVEDLVLGRRVVAFDELHLHDPGDAMLLAPLLRELVRRRVLLLATSNYEPEQLLANPLHHHLFEPVIALMREHLHVLEVDGGRDHRTTRVEVADRVAGASPASGGGFAAGAWLVGEGTAYLLEHGLAPRGGAVVLPLGSREVRARAVADGTVWFGFEELCEGRLSAIDYLDLAGRFTTWVVLDVPPLGEASEMARQRFVALVDVLCDRDRRLVLAGAPAPETLFGGSDLPPDIARMASRLQLLERSGDEPRRVARPGLSVEHLYG